MERGNTKIESLNQHKKNIQATRMGWTNTRRFKTLGQTLNPTIPKHLRWYILTGTIRTTEKSFPAKWGPKF